MTGPTQATLFANMGTLDSYMDFTSILTFGHTLIQGKVLSTIFMTPWAPLYVVYFASAMELAMVFTGAAYVVVHAVEAGVDFARGLYYNYAKWSAIADQIAVFELVVCFLFLFWSLLCVILSLVAAGEIWTALNARATGVMEYKMGVPLQWDKAIKAVTLCLLAGMTVLISAYSLGEVAEELISYFAWYDDDEQKEGDEKTDASKDDPAGTSAEMDFTYHMVTTVYGWMTLMAVALGGAIFRMSFLGLEDTYTCELETADYSSAKSIMEAMNSKDKCLSTIESAFNAIDLNGDGMISRCEDASFQVANGASEEYAFKYSTSWSLSSAKQWCYTYY